MEKKTLINSDLLPVRQPVRLPVYYCKVDKPTVTSYWKKTLMDKERLNQLTSMDTSGNDLANEAADLGGVTDNGTANLEEDTASQVSEMGGSQANESEVSGGIRANQTVDLGGIHASESVESGVEPDETAGRLKSEMLGVGAEGRIEARSSEDWDRREVESEAPVVVEGVEVELDDSLPGWLEPLEEEDVEDDDEDDVAPMVSHFPSLQLGLLSPHRLSPTATHPALPQLPQSLLCPISPSPTTEKQSQNQRSTPSDRDSANPRKPHYVRLLTRQASGRVGSSLNGHDHVKKLQGRSCAKCGDSLPDLKTGDEEELCPSCKSEKKSPPSIVFRKVGADRWVLGRFKEEEEDEEEHSRTLKRNAKMVTKEEAKQEQRKAQKLCKSPSQSETGDTFQRKPFRVPQAHAKGKTSSPAFKIFYRKFRSVACTKCAACLRKDCGKCKYCMDKPKYGGKGRLKQKCIMRRCRAMQPAKASQDLLGPYVARPSLRKVPRKRKRSSSEDTTEEDEEGENSICSGDREWTPHVKTQNKEHTATPVKHLASYVVVNPLTGEVFRAVAPPTQEQGSHKYNQVNGHPFPPNVLGAPNLPSHFTTPSGVSPGLPSYLDGVPLTLVQPKEESTDYQCWPPPTLNQPSKENGQPLNYENTLNQPSHLFQLKEELAPVECGEADRVVDIEVELDFGSPIRSSDTLGMSEEVSTEVEREVTLEEDREGSTELEPYCLAETTEVINRLDGKERALLRFLRVLRRTVLPAHWVCVMAAGPRLQLLQCSKLSTMGDTVLNIQPGFSYQLTVQRHHLLPTHTLYDSHPLCFANTSQVVSLLLELEGMAVCRGFEHGLPRSFSEPVLLVRAATCLLLVPQSQERCEHCQEVLPL
ncbi:methyl-CpG-binding domain protein 1a isoform X2 [Hypomesus transpacificus]|uniref:methyl-CpG-binding domain protein 1a isoform X2 n=1 Tax=Hypomesus transpacificus TaxID=137520 RepID=UPI001F082031|nr:methyl-CpG-binding domain protein 1a isoform X2 [Hypomesus transpacificus]